MHLHHLQRDLTLCFAKFTKLLKLQLNKSSNLKCSRDRCCTIKSININKMWKLFLVAAYRMWTFLRWCVLCADRMWTHSVHFGTIHSINFCDCFVIKRKHRNSTRIVTFILYVLLTVNLGLVPVNNPLDAQFFIRIYLFQFSTCFEHPCAHYQENQLY
jgi:hypothetical protein